MMPNHLQNFRSLPQPALSCRGGRDSGGLRLNVLLIACALSLFVAACGAVAPRRGPPAPPEGPLRASAPSAPDYWPTEGWRTSTPEDQGMDPALLERMLETVQAQDIPLHSLLIIRNGYIVSETYFGSYGPETQHELYSVTKSVIATLVGMAQGAGDIGSLQTPLAELLPGKVDPASDPEKAGITLEHLLTMTSGLGWMESDASFARLYRSRDWAQFMLDLPMAREPGAAFSYCSGCSHLLSAIVQAQTGADPLRFAEQELFAPLGIRDYRWETDPSGLPIGGWGLYLTPRDMAKLGYLYLNRGMWDGRQIVPAEWVAAATRRHTATDGRLGYGYQWWTYPEWGAYAALGRDGQTIWVAPGENLIVVTTAATTGHDPIFDLIDRYIMPAVRR